MADLGTESQLLQALGIGDPATAVYRLVIRETTLTRRDLATRLGLSPSRIEKALAELRDVGLIRAPETSASAVVLPVDPRVGLGALVRERQSELEQVAGLAEQFSVDFREAQLRLDPGQLVEVLEGQHEISSRMTALLDGAREEILNLYAPPLVNVDKLTGGDEAGKMTSGIHIRVIYAAESLREEGMLDAVLADVASGEEARVLRVVPLKLLVVDRTWAMLPLTATQSGTRGSAVLVHKSRLTDALVSLFEALWEQASPITVAREVMAADGEGPGAPPDVQLLQLLAAGLKDETIARHLNVSERTLRRRVTTLLDRLGAASRFQAGIQAARRGWL